VLHFRQRDARTVERYAVMACQRKFETTADGSAMNGGDYRLFTAFDGEKHVR